MGEVINFRDYQEEPDIFAMNAEELEAYLQQLRERIAELDQKEPRNMMSEAYEAWGELHEELEDMVDEVLDLLDDCR